MNDHDFLDLAIEAANALRLMSHNVRHDATTVSSETDGQLRTEAMDAIQCACALSIGRMGAVLSVRPKAGNEVFRSVDLVLPADRFPGAPFLATRHGDGPVEASRSSLAALGGAFDRIQSEGRVTARDDGGRPYGIVSRIPDARTNEIIGLVQDLARSTDSLVETSRVSISHPALGTAGRIAPSSDGGVMHRLPALDHPDASIRAIAMRYHLMSAWVDELPPAICINGTGEPNRYILSPLSFVYDRSDDPDVRRRGVLAYSRLHDMDPTRLPR